MRLGLFLSFLAVSLAAAQPVFAEDGAARPSDAMPSVVRIGLQKNLGPDFLIESFAPTMRLLRLSHPGTCFETSFYSADELTQAVRSRRVDAFFADSALFGVLQLETGAMQIAARAAPNVRDPSQAASFAVIVRRGSHDLYRRIETFRLAVGTMVCVRKREGCFSPHSRPQKDSTKGENP